MGGNQNTEKAIWLVYEYVTEMLGPESEVIFLVDDVRVVWFCEILQNWKAGLRTTSALTNQYFEVTYDGSKNKARIDVFLEADSRLSLI